MKAQGPPLLLLLAPVPHSLPVLSGLLVAAVGRARQEGAALKAAVCVGGGEGEGKGLERKCRCGADVRQGRMLDVAGIDVAEICLQLCLVMRGSSCSHKGRKRDCRA